MDNFLKFVEDCFRDLGAITSKRMFGGVGIYLDSKIIGLIYAGEFYIKAKPEKLEEYINRGLRQFSYEQKGRTFYLKYFVLEDEILEDTDTLKEYTRNAY